MDFFIADTHFGHANIVKYCGRPFPNSDEMDETIIRNWNAVVSKDDTVYHLGDFSLVKKNRIPEYIDALNGKIILIRGNHDRSRTITAWGKMGIDSRNGPIRYSYYLLSHEPMLFPELPNIHGHTHGNVHNGDISDHGIHVCVSCEAVNYSPISIDFIEKAIELGVMCGMREVR